VIGRSDGYSIGGIDAFRSGNGFKNYPSRSGDSGPTIGDHWRIIG
jgi:hypothetical protein